MKVKKETLKSKKGFERSVAQHQWDMLEQIEIEVIFGQLCSKKDVYKRLEKEIGEFAKTLPGYDNLISI